MTDNKLFRSLLLLTVLFTGTLYADVNISTFNIKWLGYSKDRDNTGIAKVLSDGRRDVVFIQELVAPPVPVKVSDTKTIKADKEVAAFFNAMKAEGYDYVLSSEDTGTGDKIHTNSAATEWFVAFYKSDKLSLVDSGFVADDRSNNDNYERVPYYFTFKANDGMDFTVVSMHLQPGKKHADADRRYHELQSLVSWVFAQAAKDPERDYILLGDMNVYDCDVLDRRLDDLFVLANKECLNSNLKRTEPYDQVLYIEAYTDISDYTVIDLYEIFNIPSSTPNKEVIAKYSDHHPVFFTVVGMGDDDE
ncbi:hypothetical protein [Sulfurovum sp.]|uniref:hypothetical protein n=1 Tax=Sulfurovum sp. TaxID=1969726 RepID=UPI00356A7FC6